MLWMLLITIIQVYNEKGASRKKEIQNVQFDKKMSSRKFKVGAKACAKNDEKVKERPDPQRNKRLSVPKTRPHPTKLLTCKKQRPEELSPPKEQ